MSLTNRYEQQFLDALKSIFIGAKVEGESGYINLMKIKAKYFEKGVFPQLMKDIDSACKPFEKGFREELFDKLYDFFQHYFSESGSIYFRNTAQHHNIYEKVYTDDRDVMLFWKTHMLYYVKTDRLFNSMDVEVDGEKFYFDVSGMELKRANEKRELTYAFKSFRDGKTTLTVEYSEKGRKTKVDEILKAVKAKGVTLSEETLEKAFRVFEKQSEVDYFINKNARAFLCEQFDLWMYQYLFKGESIFNEIRLQQLQTIKEIAYKIIDFIAQFEDELVRIWNKPKFVLNSNYIITLDKVSSKEPGLLTHLLFEHPGIKQQIKEWQELGMVDKKFKPEMVFDKDLVGDPLFPQYQHLPLDTKYFKDIELAILSFFDDLDSSLDGWLIHSENYQALTTLLPKFRERISAVYIDPPYNTGPSEIKYVNYYKDSSWLSLFGDRLSLSKDFLETDSAMAIAIDDYLLVRLSELLDESWPQYERIMVVVNHHPQGSGGNNISRTHEYMLYMVPRGKDLIRGKEKTGDIEYRSFMLSGPSENKSRRGRPNSFYALVVDPKKKKIVRIEPPPALNEKYVTKPTSEGYERWYPIGTNGREQVWSRSYESALNCLRRGEITISENNSVKLAVKVAGKRSLLFSNWIDSKYNAGPHGTQMLRDLFGDGESFPYPKSHYLVADAIDSMTWHIENPIIFDFFGGSGTTAHAVMNLNREDGAERKYLVVEMADYFKDVTLPRVKKLCFSNKWKNGKAQEGKGISHFAKYFELEQYEDALRRAHYEDAPLFVGTQDTYTGYVFLRDLKLLDAVKVDKKKNEVEVNLDRLYNDIDLAETLSCLTGKWIKRITENSVVFQDGTTISLSSPKWEDVKPLIWW